MNRQDTPCHEDNSNSRKFKETVSQSYFHDQNTTDCLHVNACWIPTVKDVLTHEEQRTIQPCTLWSQYICMQQRLSLSIRIMENRNPISHIID